MKKKVLSLVLALVMILTMLPVTAVAETTLNCTPYAKVNYDYSSGVTVGTIRYISQITSSSYFRSSYWPTSAFGGYSSPGTECGTACISMALSYVGINKTPKTILEAHNGVTYFDGWGVTMQNPSVVSGMNNYINGNGKYSPVIIHLPGYSSAGHYVILAGKVSDTVYQVVDPANASVWNITINGTSASYNGKSDTINQIMQYYNPNATMPVTNYTVTFNANGGSCSTSTKSVASGSTISSLPTATRTGYIFDGWYTQASGGTKITTSTKFTSNTTVYAHWTADQKQVTLYNADGSTWKTASVNVGSQYTLPSDYPKADNKYFSGWSYTNGATTYELRPGDKITVNGAVKIYPVYVSHDKAISGEEVYIYNIADFTDDGYDIKEVTHTNETKVDKSYWTSWSAYSTTPVTASATVEVRTTPMYRYYYFLCPYCGAREPFSGVSDCGKTIPGDGSAWHETWSTVAYKNSSYKSFSYTQAKYYTTSLGDGKLWVFSSGNVNATAVGTIDSTGSAAVIKTGYSSRQYVEKYETVRNTVTAYKIVPSGCRHEYESVHVPATCEEYEHTIYTCKLCGENYTEYPADVYGDWTTQEPVGVNKELVETKTQYRYSNYETTTSYNATMSGWKQESSKWEQSGSGTVDYVSSWPSGFNTSHSLYSTYNKSPKTASETTTAKTTVSSSTAGYIYYHWCRGTYTDGPINRATSKTRSGEFTSFHAFFNTKAPSSLTASSDGDGSYTFANSSCCKDSHWYYPITVTRQSYTTYKKLFTYSRWTDWSAWSDTPVTASSTKKVETQKLYRYVNAELGEHQWDEGVITTPVTCIADGVQTFTCGICGETRTETVKALGHDYQDGICTRCGGMDPDYQKDPVVISVGDENAAAGDTVTVPVYINDNIGFAGFTFVIDYDKTAMTLTDITKGDVLQTSDSGMFTKNVAGSTINYIDSVNISSEGALYNLVFAINDDAADDTYSVSVALKDGESSNFVDENSKSVRTDIHAGSITVETVTAPVVAEGNLVVSNAQARAGEEVSVSVSIEDNPGIMVMALGIDYDREKLELVGFEDGIMTGWKVAKNAVWIGSDDVTADGVILTLKFKVLDDVEDGDISVTMLFSEGDIANHEEEIIMPGISAGTITIYSQIPGDVTGDGKVNALDLVRLQRYLSGEDVAIVGSADISGDGKVNALDLVRLQRYLSGEDVTIH